METKGFKERKRAPRESSIEKYLVNKIRKMGGLCKKWVCPGSSGEPDRIVIYGGRVVFVELKRPGGRLSSIQKVRQVELEEAGAQVWTLSSRADIDDLIFTLELTAEPSQPV